MVRPDDSVTRAWPIRVEPTGLCELARTGRRDDLLALARGRRQTVPHTRRQPHLFHPLSAADRCRHPLAPLSGRAARLVQAFAAADSAAGLLETAFGSLFRQRARRVGHRFDLQADYLAAAREYLLLSLRSADRALPPPVDPVAEARFIETFADSVRQGAIKHADRELYRLTKQMVREGVLTWRDERGRVVEHPRLRTEAADPAPLVAEREFRRQVRAFVVRFGPRLLERKVWERFRLHYFEGWTQAAIAAYHGVSQQAVSESLATAAVKLRQAFLARREGV